jgi:hypothetical protein
MNEPNITMTEICPTGLFYSINMVYNVYMYMILMTFLPFFLLSILNALIVKQVQNKTKGKLRERSVRLPSSPPPRSPVLVATQHANDVHATLVRMEVCACVRAHTLRSVMLITVHMLRDTIPGVHFGQWTTRASAVDK